MPVAALGDPVLAAIWSPGGEELRFGLKPGDRGHIVELDKAVNGEADYIYVYRSLVGYGETPWTVGAVLPAETAAREVERLMRIAAVGFALLALAVAAAALVGRRLARPVAGLVALAEGVERLEFGRIPALPRSRVRELDVAGQALNRMVAALRWFELYLPKRLVHRLLAQGDDAGKAYEREVTVMFTDIVGFSRLAARLTPSDTAAFLNGHFALLGRCIEAEGGTIDKYIGDSVMAFWGAPDEQADHAERACAAALAIARTLAADNAERRADGLEPVRLRIGISTGRVLVGNIGAPGRVNYTLVGDVVNLAQRLEQLGKEVEDAGDVVVLITENSRACLKGVSRRAPSVGARCAIATERSGCTGWRERRARRGSEGRGLGVVRRGRRRPELSQGAASHGFGAVPPHEHGEVGRQRERSDVDGLGRMPAPARARPRRARRAAPLAAEARRRRSGRRTQARAGREARGNASRRPPP